ncbi:hypothetical protein PTI98_002872 [Pleurotus ostreatus]|nr:hypothetical protein PTI98_002872 [Pleurotus ostreatus]
MYKPISVPFLSISPLFIRSSDSASCLLFPLPFHHCLPSSRFFEPYRLIALSFSRIQQDMLILSVFFSFLIVASVHLLWRFDFGSIYFAIRLFSRNIIFSIMNDFTLDGICGFDM